MEALGKTTALVLIVISIYILSLYQAQQNCTEAVNCKKIKTLEKKVRKLTKDLRNFEDFKRDLIKLEVRLDFVQDQSGRRGKKGDPGPPGDPGVAGVNGVDGINGSKGDKGNKGETGPPGQDGAKGQKGDTGPKGPPGNTGPQGEKGDTGPPGPKGNTGPQGEKGDTGLPGPKGNTGPKGDKGDTGLPGHKGNTGPKGDKGDTGPPGLPGKGCDWSHWGQWSYGGCSKGCGTGFSHGTRTRSTLASCTQNRQTQTRLCNEHSCCEWGAWGPCNCCNYPNKDIIQDCPGDLPRFSGIQSRRLIKGDKCIGRKGEEIRRSRCCYV